MLGPHGRNVGPTQGDSSTNQYMQEEEGGDPSHRVLVSEDGNLIDLNFGVTQFKKVP